MAGEIGENEWRQILELAHAAADLPQEERQRFVDSSCSDPAIAARVLHLAEEFSNLVPGIDIGSQVGRFTVTGRIGKGGMGEVFSARDSELERTVALKVLLSDAGGSAGSGKIVREARTASALNHPNIVTIHEVLKVGSAVAIVMEFVPGESLRKWIKTPHTTSESLAVMLQMASAVEAAHAAGIVHRDLKPENVTVRPDNRIKILDFGLARSINVGDRATLSASTAGFAGTFLYMAPEQWSGAPPSAASDVFSLGVIFYEVLTGQHPFESPSLVDLMKTVADKTPPPPSTLQPSIPPLLDTLILRMLVKTPADRPSAGEVMTSLTQIESSLIAPAVITRPSRFGWPALAAIVGLLSLIGISWRLGLPDLLFHRSHIAEELTPVPLANELGLNNSPTFSPDGNQVAFTWNGKNQDNFDIYVKVVGAQGTVRLTSSPEIDYSPVWSPDGKTIAFCRGPETGNASVWTMSSLGGSEKKIYDLHWRADFLNRHLSWSPDGKRLVFPDQLSDETNPLIELDVATGKSRQITFPTGSEVDLQPAYSPDGKFLAFVRDQGGTVDRIHLLPLNGGSPNPFPLEWEGLQDVNAERPVWVPDSRSLTVISRQGGEYRLWIGPAEQFGKPRILVSLGSNLFDSAISSNGKLAVVYRRYDSDVYKLDLGRLRDGIPVTPEPVANSTRLELNPKVSPDGLNIAFESNRSGYMEIWAARADGSNAAPLTEMQSPVTGSPAWSHDGRRIAFDSRLGGSPRLYVIDALGGKPTAITKSEDTAVVPMWSIDDAWMYFSSDRLKTSEIWRMPSAGGHAEQVTKTGGFAATFSPDGKQLYYSSTRARVTELRSLDLATGEQKTIAPDVLRRSFVDTRDGLYYVSGQLLGPRDLKLIENSGTIKQIYRFKQPLAEGLDISPDGRTLFFGQLEQDGSELMLVEKFWQ